MGGIDEYAITEYFKEIHYTFWKLCCFVLEVLCTKKIFIFNFVIVATLFALLLKVNQTKITKKNNYYKYQILKLMLFTVSFC